MGVISRKANGNIAPSRFVKTDTTGDGLALQAGAGDKILGVSQAGTRRTPYGGLDDGFAAIAGEDLEVFVQGEHNVMLELGGTVVAGDRLKSDANGKGITTTTTGDEMGAATDVAGTSGQVIPVRMISPSQF